MELIPAELTALTSQSSVDPFISAEEYAQLRAEVDKLANGVFDDTANGFISERIEFAKRPRQAQISHLELRPDMKQKLKAVSSCAFPVWLDEQLLCLDGQKILSAAESLTTWVWVFCGIAVRRIC
jgi:hypothetical protein